MSLNILDVTTLAAVQAATSQEAQLAALAAPFVAAGNVTVRISDEGDLNHCDLGVYPGWVMDTNVPRGMTLGARSSYTPTGTLFTPPANADFNAAGLPVFKIDASVGGAGLSFAAGVMPPAARANLSDAVAAKFRITATESLPVSAYPAWRPAAGDAAVITASGVLNDLNPLGKAWNPTPANEGPWRRRTGLSGFSTKPGFCGGVWNPTLRQWFFKGGGHASFTMPPFDVWSAVSLLWSLAETPLPSDCYDYAAGPSAAQIAATYGPAQFDETNVELIGDYSGYGALAQPGVRQADAGHTYLGQVHVPGPSVGNTNGIILMCHAETGSLNEDATTASSGHYWDCDATPTTALKRTYNKRAYSSAAAGGVCYFGGSIDRVFGLTHFSGGAFKSAVEMWTPSATPTTSTSQWTSQPTGNSIQVDLFSGGLITDLVGNRLIQCMPATGQGPSDLTYANATQHQFWAIDATALKAGSSPNWSQLTVSNPGGTWPVKIIAGSPNHCGSVAWSPHPNGSWYAINGNHNSTSIWKMTLSGTTLTITEETLATAMPMGSTGSPTGGLDEPMNRMFYVDFAGCYVIHDYCVTNKPVAMRPPGT